MAPTPCKPEAKTAANNSTRVFSFEVSRSIILHTILDAAKDTAAPKHAKLAKAIANDVSICVSRQKYDVALNAISVLENAKSVHRILSGASGRHQFAGWKVLPVA